MWDYSNARAGAGFRTAGRAARRPRPSLAILVAGMSLAGAACGSRSDTRQPVREFMAAVAHDVTTEGPAAWKKHFADDPGFFMAADGQLQFADNRAAAQGIEGLTHMIRQIQLQWGDDLRVDPVAADVAVVGCSWHEVRVIADGSRIEDHGYFTGTAEYRHGRWQFRNVHWSAALAADHQ